MPIEMKLLRRLCSLFGRSKLEADMVAEMRVHLDEQTQRNLAAGMSPADARAAAHRQFGGVAQIQERAREQRGWQWLENFCRDVRFAVRQLNKSRGVTIVVILTLGLGIGAATAIYSIVHALLLAPLPYREAHELVQVQSHNAEQGAAGLAPATFADVAAGTRSFATLAAQYYFYVNLTGIDTPAQLNSADVTSDFFELFGVAPALGRTWTRDEAKAGATPVVVLGHALWRGQFHARASIIGEQILLDDVPFTVIGVMPASFKDPSETAQLWRPMRPGMDDLQNRSSRYWTTFARLKSGVTLEQANAELAILQRRLELAYPSEYDAWILQAADLRRLVVGNYHAGLLVVLGAVACVMLITCANVAGLGIVRTVARRKELAIRVALGSSRSRLMRQLLTESLLAAILGGAAGVLLAHLGLHALLSSLPEGWLPRADEIALNQPVLATTLALTLLAGLASGLAPGLAASRIDAQDALQQGGRGSAGPAGRRMRSGLVVGQIALALIVLAGTGLLGRSFLTLMRTPSGLDAGRVLALTVSLPASRYDSPPRCWDFFSRAEIAVAAVPGVEAAGFTQTSPFRWGIPSAFTPVGTDNSATTANLPVAFVDPVSVDFFKALGIPLRHGRTFTAADDYTARPMVVLNQTAARRYFGTGDPVGRFISAGADQPALEVVGVVGDVRRAGLNADVPLQVYRPLAQRTPAFATLMVRTPLPPATLAQSVQAALWRIDPDIPISDIATMDTFVRRSVTQPRLYLTLFSLFAMLALLLAAIGLYGLIAHGVEQRRREFGIRAALGARPRAVVGLILREGAGMILLGLTLGLAGAWAAVQLMQNMVFATSIHDPTVFLGAPLLLGVIALLACLIPARRATKVDPVVALRAE